MYDDFKAIDRWSGEEVHFAWVANIVAIATRHADAVDVKFLAQGAGENGRPVWIALPAEAWVRFKQQTGHSITDRLAIQIAGHYLKQAIESGYDSGRETYTLTIDEVLQHLDAVMQEAKHTDLLPIVPRIAGTGNSEADVAREVTFSPGSRPPA
ncbi:MAG: hypothetical protein ABI383_01860 [Acidobacteriaceae bacterium]